MKKVFGKLGLKYSLAHSMTLPEAISRSVKPRAAWILSKKRPFLGEIPLFV